MIYFQSDYVEGAHPDILGRLAETNLVQQPGYGTDAYCAAAREKIRAACGMPDADVHFLVGGTIANVIIISSILRPYQGVLSAQSGHIATHETGAVEAAGHKVLELPSPDGKLTAGQVDKALKEHAKSPTREHMVQPGMVYISFPTESGLLYTKAELEALSAVCRAHHVPLFVDGARLGYALASPENDVTLKGLVKACDVFYIGGTKCGALFGEAVVFSNTALSVNFRYMMKRQGGMLAKGRLLGLQFDVLFENDLYTKIAAHAVTQALRIRRAFEAAGVELFHRSPTNQQFVILNKAQYEKLSARYAFEIWCELDGGCRAVRFCTSWATRVEDVAALEADIALL